jgi:cellulose biosynthesis protein BcsQ
LIVVEGLDNSGKTTLVTYLAAAFSQLRPIPSIGNKHDIVEIYKMGWAEAYQPDPFSITDRARLISEYVYNPVLKRRTTAFETREWMSMLGKFVENGPHLIIYCNRRIEKVREKWGANGDQLDGVRENLVRLDTRYKTMMSFLELVFNADRDRSEIHHYDFDQDNIALIYQEVGEYLERIAKDEYQGL